ncbi:MAG: pseudaminic acid synthase [Chlamydiales bacterium]|jgi:pseudaminic acid synthase
MYALKLETPKGTKVIGHGCPTFIVAEMSGNHCHSLPKAKAIIDGAAEAGADAIKLQTYTADTLTIDCKNKYFQITEHEDWKGKTLYELYQTAFTPWEWHAELKEYAEDKGLLFFSTPFDETAVDFLEDLGVQLYKVASFMTENLPLLDKIGSVKKAVIISRGLTSLSDLELALSTLREAGCPQEIILHCVSAYPATPSQMNLRTIPDLSGRFHLLAGLSDHTLSIAPSIAAVVLGACVIEKHLTTDRSKGGPDAAFSLEPHELKQMVQAIRDTEQALGKPTYVAALDESKSKIFKQSIFVVKDIKKGEHFSQDNIRIIRPGFGLQPREFKKVLGKQAENDLSRGTPLQWEDISSS